jgi:hypothetical protein
MGIIILYLVSLGLFWVASQLVPFLFIPIIRLTKAVLKDSISTELLLFIVNLFVTILLLYITQYIWSLLGYKIGLFPIIVAIQNFLAAISRQSNENSKRQATSVVIGSILFLAVNFFL